VIILKLQKLRRSVAEHSDGIVLSGLSAESVEQIKKSLTFDNPAYATVQRYSRYAYTNVPPFLTYYEHRGGVIKVPRGYNLSGLNCSEINSTVAPKVDHAPFVLTLRDSQKEAAEAYINSNKTLTLHGCIQMPTGKGKSILGLYLAAFYSLRTLIVVHKDDLVKGWQKDIELAFGKKVTPGLIKAKSRNVGHFLTIATVQTLNRLSEEELEKLYSQFGFVIQDEVHRCVLGDTLVLKEDGGAVPIINIHDGEKIFGGQVSNSFNKRSPVYRLSYKHGFIEGSPDHLTFCLDKRKYYKKNLKCCDFSNFEFEVKPISELDSNYVVPVKRFIPHVCKNNVSPEEARFAAMIMCDGHLDKEGNRVKVNVKKDKEFYEGIFRAYVPTCKSSIDCRGNLTVWITSTQIKYYLEHVWGIPRGKKSSFISIPEFLYYSPLETIKAFIETCFSCEGDLNKATGGYRLNFNTCSKSLAQGLSLLLRKFGIVCNFQTIPHSQEGHSVSYRLVIGGAAFNDFFDIFTILPRKTPAGRNYNNIRHNRIVGEYLLSDVKSVEYLGYTDTVYDFEVQDTHSFIANGVLTHNCPATSFSLVSRFRARYKLGLTATPERTDGLAHVINLYYGEFCYRYKSQAEDTDILPVHVIVRKNPFYFNPLCEKIVIKGREQYRIVDLLYPDRKDLTESQKRLSDVPYNIRPKVSFQTIDDIVVREIKEFVCADILREYNKGRSCVVFFTQKEHCRLYYEYLAESISEEHLGLYYGDNTNNEEVREKAEKTRKFVTLTTYAKATEGTNVKQWEVEFLVSSINNEKNVEQAVGRIRRTKEGKKITPVLLYDYRTPYVYSLASHGNTRDRRYKALHFTFEGQKPRQGLFTRGYK